MGFGSEISGFGSDKGALALRGSILEAFRSVALGFINEILGVSSEVLCSSLIVQQLTDAEGFAWAPTLSFRFMSEIVGFSSGVLSSELLGLSSGIPF